LILFKYNFLIKHLQTIFFYKLKWVYGKLKIIFNINETVLMNEITNKFILTQYTFLFPSSEKFMKTVSSSFPFYNLKHNLANKLACRI